MSRPASADAAVSSTIVVPNTHPMVALLGANDENIKQFERDFPEVDVLVRGNEIHLSGDVTEVGLAEQVLAEMLSILRTGQALTPDAVERSVAMLRADRSLSPSQLLTANILSTRGKAIRRQDAEPEALRRRHRPATRSSSASARPAPGKTYLAVAKAVQALQSKQINRIILTRPAVEAGERLGFLPGTLEREDRPLPASAVRRAARHDRSGPDPATDDQRDDRGRAAGLHAWPHPQRCVHHPRRGAEHHRRADEDVPDPAGLRLHDGGHRRRHAGGPARRDDAVACASCRTSWPRSTTCSSASSPAAMSCGTNSWATSWTPTADTSSRDERRRRQQTEAEIDVESIAASGTVPARPAAASTRARNCRSCSWTWPR